MSTIMLERSGNVKSFLLPSVDFFKHPTYPRLPERRHYPFYPERAMTIGVGFSCDDGIVLATDSQYTQGPSKTNGPKLFVLADLPDLAVVIAGAGRVAFMRRATEKIGEAIKGLESPTLEQVRTISESTLSKFFEDYIYPMPESKQGDFDFQLILGVWTKEGFGLFETDKSTVVPPAKDYCSIGYGYYVSEYALNLAGSAPGLTVEKAKLVAALCVKAAKDYVDYCGGETNIYAIRPNGPHHVERVSRSEVRDAEDYTRNITDFIKQVIGFLEVGPDAELDDEMLAVIVDEVRDSIKKLRDKRAEYRRERKKILNRAYLLGKEPDW